MFQASNTTSAGYFPLASNMVTQINKAFCGIASSVMVLNCFPEIYPPESFQHPGYHYWDQENYFNEKTEAIKHRKDIEREGLSLAEFGELTAVHGLSANITYAYDYNYGKFINDVKKSVARRDQFLVVNYLRGTLGELPLTQGHFSPVAAMMGEEYILLLDVSRYKYPPLWVSSKVLFASLLELSEDLPRGWATLYYNSSSSSSKANIHYDLLDINKVARKPYNVCGTYLTIAIIFIAVFGVFFLLKLQKNASNWMGRRTGENSGLLNNSIDDQNVVTINTKGKYAV